MIPVLQKPQKLPTRSPCGPSLEALLRTKTQAGLEVLETILEEIENPVQQQAALDKTYEIRIEDLETTINRATSTVIKHPGHRCAP
eukprot:1074373-Pyramimonas_sp.AAC.1